jgi:hypothetical protein
MSLTKFIERPVHAIVMLIIPETTMSRGIVRVIAVEAEVLGPWCLVAHHETFSVV